MTFEQIHIARNYLLRSVHNSQINKRCTRTTRVNILRKIQLYGPSMFAVKAKIYRVLYNQASSIAFDETSSYWPALKSS